MNRIFAVIIVLFSCYSLSAQVEDTTTSLNQEIEEVKIIQNFARKYQYRLGLMRRVYPIALRAQEIIEEHETKLASITNKSKRKRLGKQTHKKLKNEFNYNIRDLYIVEGELLIRLIHRESDMTVAEIIEVFEGKTRRKWYNGLARLGGQNLEDEYDPHGEDYLTELIIEEIEAGTISFSLKMKDVDKAEFKDGMKEYRSGRKAMRKNRRGSKRKK